MKDYKKKLGMISNLFKEEKQRKQQYDHTHYKKLSKEEKLWLSLEKITIEQEKNPLLELLKSILI